MYSSLPLHALGIGLGIGLEIGLGIGLGIGIGIGLGIGLGIGGGISLGRDWSRNGSRDRARDRARDRSKSSMPSAPSVSGLVLSLSMYASCSLCELTHWFRFGNFDLLMIIIAKLEILGCLNILRQTFEKNNEP